MQLNQVGLKLHPDEIAKVEEMALRMHTTRTEIFKRALDLYIPHVLSYSESLTKGKQALSVWLTEDQLAALTRISKALQMSIGDVIVEAVSDLASDKANA